MVVIPSGFALGSAACLSKNLLQCKNKHNYKTKNMRKEMKRVYQSPAINVVKLGTMAILAGSDISTTTNEILEEGTDLSGNF